MVESDLGGDVDRFHHGWENGTKEILMVALITVVSDVVPLSWQLRLEEGLPVIHVTHRDGRQEWTVLSAGD
jgi:hypothetical protein